MERVLIFSRTKHGADRIVKLLSQSGIPANAIHGNKSQPQRERSLAEFRSGKAKILVATDIAARGIDVTGVSHVVNFDMPPVPEQYVHRIGRTARAGAAGVAISFIAPDERPYLKGIERLTGSHLKMLPLPDNFIQEDQPGTLYIYTIHTTRSSAARRPIACKSIREDGGGGGPLTGFFGVPRPDEAAAQVKLVAVV
jgi:ATP-dependent RNA helicase RhlE